MKKLFLLLGVNLIIILISCRQIKEAQNLAYCEFRVAGVENVKIAGIPLIGITKVSDLNIVESGKLAAKVLEGKLPFTFDLKLAVKNPNKNKAALNELEYILLIDDAELLTGTTRTRFEVAPQSISIMTLFIEMDLIKIFTGKTGKEIIEAGISLAGISNSTSRLTMKLKPTFVVAGRSIKYPGYIKVTKDF